jgi:thymidine phosphorylase
VLPQEFVRAKRDGTAQSAGEIEEFVAGLTSGAVTEGQAAAWAMAVYFHGLDVEERVALTMAMARSGTMLAWDLPGPVLDKHSTGGVGDTVSLMLAPLVAACGGFVPMVSGRGLGHTGGTYDKVESIPGYQAAPSMELFREVVGSVGCAVIGQTTELAPADKRLYAIRDVTATVESIGLITASILSKKLAAGLGGLAMDVKVGNGAFMTSVADARQLARSIVEVADGAGLPTTALLTDMDQPLASAAGNAVEVAYAADYLTGTVREPRMHAVVVGLCAEMLVLGGLASDADDGARRAEDALAGGAAAERFERMVAALGGPHSFLSEPARHLPSAPVVVEVGAERAGTVSAVDTRAVGLAVVALGGGRTRPQDPIDHAVGLTHLAARGDAVGGDRPLAVVHARDDAGAAAAAAAVRAAYRVGGAEPKLPPVIRARVVER